MSPSVEPFPIQDLDVLLKQSLGDDLEIKNLQWKALTDPGENFGSIIMAIDVLVKLKNKEKMLHLVGKLPPNSEFLLDLFNCPVTFNKELHYYSGIAKEFINIQRESGIEEEDICVVAPGFFGGRLGMNDPKKFDEQAAILLENLNYSDYVTEDRITGLDKCHTKFAVKMIAKFHALAIGLKYNKPNYFKKTALPVMQEKLNDTSKKCVHDLIQKTQEVLETMDKVKPYMQSVNKTIEVSMSLYLGEKEAEEPWATLTHSDMWVNNILFQHNRQGDVTDMKIVDFQLLRYDYGMIDLIFFLVSSMQKEILIDCLDEMLDLYYDTFVGYLKKLKVNTEPFTRQKYDELVKYCALNRFSQCLMMVQVIQAPRIPPSNDNNRGDILLNRSLNDVCKEKLLVVLSAFEKKGWLLK